MRPVLAAILATALVIFAVACAGLFAVSLN